MNIQSIPHDLYRINTIYHLTSGDSSLSFTSGEKTDMFRSPSGAHVTENAPMLLFKADENFVLTASIEHEFVSKWDAGALIIKSDALNWVKFCFEKDYTGVKRVVSVVTRGVSDDSNAMEVNTSKIYYKAAKTGNVVLLYYSEDGNKWFLIRNLHLDFSNGVEAGFLVQSPVGEKCTVTFADIKYEVRKITDPYNPEK